MRKPPNSEGKNSGLSSALSLGFDIAAGVGVFAFGGYWLDQKRGGGVRWTLVGMCLGFVYAGYEIWRVLRGLEHQDSPPKADEGNAAPHKTTGDAAGRAAESDELQGPKET